MRRLLALALLALSLPALAQAQVVGSFPTPLTTALGGTNSTTGATVIQGSTTLPATCTVRDVYIDTDQPIGAGLYVCTATNTWTNVTTGAGVSGGAANRFTLWSGAATVTYSDYLSFDTGANTNPLVVFRAATDLKPVARFIGKFTDASNMRYIDVLNYDAGSALYLDAYGTGSATLASVNFRINAGTFLSSTSTVTSLGIGSLAMTINSATATNTLYGATVLNAYYASVVPATIDLAAAQTADALRIRNSSGTVLASVNAAGDGMFRHHLTTGTAPSVGGSCGTSPSVAGQDSAMVITAGTVAPTSCAVTFNVAWTNAPVCTANAETTTTPLNVVTTTTTVTISAVALTASEKLYVTCMGY